MRANTIFIAFSERVQFFDNKCFSLSDPIVEFSIFKRGFLVSSIIPHINSILYKILVINLKQKYPQKYEIIIFTLLIFIVLCGLLFVCNSVHSFSVI